VNANNITDEATCHFVLGEHVFSLLCSSNGIGIYMNNCFAPFLSILCVRTHAEFFVHNSEVSN